MFEPKRAYPLLLLALVLGLVFNAKFFFVVALLLLAVLIARPSLLELPVELFEIVTRFIGTWASNIVLGAIFYLIVVPYGYAYRALKKDIVAHFFSPRHDGSYFTAERKAYSSEHFEKPW